MRILIATVQVPFIVGGAELHAEGLRAALVAAGHRADIVTVPFNARSPEQLLETMWFCRKLDLTEISRAKVDRLIGLKFPAYLIPHPDKVLWILHQHRTAYDLLESNLSSLDAQPGGKQAIEAIRRADREWIPEARAIFSNSLNVSRRLKKYCGIDSLPLYHPPPSAERYFSAQAQDYFLSPSRLNPLKRQDLILRALAQARRPVHVRFIGEADNPRYGEQLRRLTTELGLDGRVEWLGRVQDHEKIGLYAHCLGVLYPPLDEDYGYVTLESMLASKPIITCHDSGGPLEFVKGGETGLISGPTPEELAAVMEELWADRAKAEILGKTGYELYRSLKIDWSRVVDSLLG